jgi:hypothetical protein
MSVTSRIMSNDHPCIRVQRFQDCRVTLCRNLIAPVQRSNSWTSLGQKSYEFSSLLLTVTSTTDFLPDSEFHAKTIVCRFRCASLPCSILTLPPVVFTLSTGTAYCHRPTLFNPGQALAQLSKEINILSLWNGFLKYGCMACLPIDMFSHLQDPSLDGWKPFPGRGLGSGPSECHSAERPQVNA